MLAATAAFEAIVIGGGPAGLQAALMLGRGMVKTLLIDEGKPRNSIVTEFHNFLGQDGGNPAVFRQKQREHISTHYGEFVSFSQDVVSSISGSAGNFLIHTESNKSYSAHRILLAMGLKEDVPAEIQPMYYKSIFQCPFCHGIELRGKQFALVVPHMEIQVYMFRNWSQDLMIFTNGTALPWITEEFRKKCSALNVPIEEGVISRYEAAKNDPTKLVAIVMADGRRIPREVVYTKLNYHQSKIVQDLKLELDPMGFVKVNGPKLETSVPGIAAVGDMTTMMHSVANAVGSAAQASAGICMDIGIIRAEAKWSSH